MMDADISEYYCKTDFLCPSKGGEFLPLLCIISIFVKVVGHDIESLQINGIFRILATNFNNRLLEEKLNPLSRLYSDKGKKLRELQIR